MEVDEVRPPGCNSHINEDYVKLKGIVAKWIT